MFIFHGKKKGENTRAKMTEDSTMQTTTTYVTTTGEVKTTIVKRIEGDREIYDDVEIEDMELNEETGIYTYPCPCGDKFEITQEQLMNGEDIARCPSCSLLIRVIYDIEEDDDDGNSSNPSSIAVAAY